MARLLINREIINNQVERIEHICRVDVEELPQFDIDYDRYDNYIDYFFDNCYVPVGNEKDIENLLSRRNGLICIAGIQGIGKSSTLEKVMNELRNNGSAVLKIDFNNEKKLINIKDPEKFLDALDKKIVKRILFEFYDINPEGINPIDQLLLELLSARPKKKIKNTVFEDFVLERLDLEALHKENEISQSYNEWIRTGNNSKPCKEYYKRRTALQNRLGIKELIWGLSNLPSKEEPFFKNFVLFLDNCDRLEHHIQPFYLSIVNDITQNFLPSKAKTVFAIRPENLSRPPEQLSARRSTMIHVEYYDQGKKTLDKFQGIYHGFNRLWLEGEIDKILQKRISTLKKRDIDIQYKILANKHPDKSEKELFSQRRIISKKYDEKWKFIETLTKLITDTYMREKFENITNYSVRSILDTYPHFLKYMVEELFEKTDDEIRKLLEKTPEDLEILMESYFYAWLAFKGDDELINLPIYDLVKLFYTCDYISNPEVEQPSCYLEHLILTRLYNFEKEAANTGSRYNCTKIREIVKELKGIGFSRPRILKAIHFLCFIGPSGGHLLELRIAGRDPKMQSWKDLRDNDDIWLTPRGRLCCTDTTHKYTYLLYFLYRQKKETPSISLALSPGDILKDTEFLSQLVDMHLSGLASIKKNTWNKWGTNWLEEYRKRYGIRPKHKKTHYLQLERMFYNHIKYLDKFFEHKDLKLLKKISNHFAKGVERLGSSGRDDFFFVRLLGTPDQESGSENNVVIETEVAYSPREHK